MALSPTNPAEAWLRLAAASSFLCMEAATVVWLRSLVLIAGGPAGKAEAERMVREKFVANLDLAARFATGGPLTPEQVAASAIAFYKPKVTANRKRLMKVRRAAN